jgi:hypothetical protein
MRCSGSSIWSTVNPTRDSSGSNLMPALRKEKAASRLNPPLAVGRLASCLIDRRTELRCAICEQLFGRK